MKENGIRGNIKIKTDVMVLDAKGGRGLINAWSRTTRGPCRNDPSDESNLYWLIE